MINLDGVSVEFGSTRVFSNVSLSIDAGTFVALVGPNGAGKTTLLRTINGLVAPSTGTVSVGGAPVHSLTARELSQRVATVPQETSLGFDFSVRDLVAMGRTPHRGRFATVTDADRAAVDRALDRTATAQLADRSVGTLSGGERQRVLLARALAQETPVLLLDEPTANLDVNHQVQTLTMASELADSGKTVVSAIHDLELAARFCETVILLGNGMVVAHGDPMEVLTSNRIERVFGIPAVVATNPITGTPIITPVTRDIERANVPDELAVSYPDGNPDA